MIYAPYRGASLAMNDLIHPAASMNVQQPVGCLFSTRVGQFADRRDFAKRSPAAPSYQKSAKRCRDMSIRLVGCCSGKNAK